MFIDRKEGGDDMEIKRTEQNAIDILKFALAIFVLTIHSGVDKTVISPLIRIAVPTFFIISAYLFFSKIEKMNDKREELNALWHLVKRNLLLYAFWVAVQFPIFLYSNHYYVDFFGKGIWYAIRDILFGGGFTGAWYIIALALGTIVIYFLSRKISAGWLLLITFPLYVMCCFCTNYRGLFASDGWVTTFNTVYEQITQNAFNTSLPGALIWIAMGNWLVKHQKSIKNNLLYIVLGVSVVLIVIERCLIVKYHLAYLDDCYFSLLPLCPSLFLLIKRIDFSFESKFRFREMSTLIYVIHGTCGRIVGFICKAVPLDIMKYSLTKLSITLLAALIGGLVFLWIRNRSKLAVLKYAC